MHRRTRLYIDALPLTTARTSGIGHMLAAIVRELGSRPSVVDNYEIILFGPRSGSDRIKAWGFPNVRYKTLPFPKKVTTLLNFMRLLPPVDLWLGKGIYLFGNFVNYPLTKGSSSITYVHDFCYLHYPDFLRPKVRRVLQSNLPRWMRRSDRIVTVSEDARKDIAEYYPELAERTRTVLNGVDLSLFKPQSESEIQSIKAKYGIESDYIIFVGNIEPRKNLERLIKAFCALPTEIRKRYSLVLIGGDGWLNEQIHQAIDQASNEGNMIIWPKTYVGDEDLPALYSGARAATLVSVHEGFGMPLIESMACGTPVVSGDIASLHEVVGSAGLYVDPNSTEAIAGGLKQIITDDAVHVRLSQAGLEQVKQFEWSATVDNLIAVIAEVDNKELSP